MATKGGRAFSGPWGRLKAVNIDPLESLGLPSKGDNRLSDFKTQERYYTKIVDRYMSFCSSADCSDELLRRFAALNLQTNETNGPLRQSSTAASASGSSVDALQTENKVQGSKDLSVLIMAMRKLREGIVASNRVDDFAIQAYIFCIRLSILVKQMESYHPALLHLLRKMHPVSPLSNLELQEFVGYLVLDLACRQHDLAQAHLIRCHYSLKDSKVDAVLSALIHDNYHTFWRAKKSVDGYKSKLMEFAEEGVRLQALKCLGRSYLTVDLDFLEHATNSTWPALVSDHRVGWELQDKVVVIRKPKAR